MTPEEAADRLEIERVLSLYFRSMDTRDYALLHAVFAPEATVHYEALGGARTSWQEMIPAFRDFNGRFRFMQHLAGQVLIEVDGDEAESSATLRAVHVQETHEGETNTWVLYGLYRDRFVRTAAGWRIRHRHFEARHSEGRLLPFDRVKRFPDPVES